MLIVTLWWLLFFTAIGLGIGSFLNAVIYRLPRDISLRNPRWSTCPLCHHRIRWYHNIPVISFILLRGRCHYCAAPISVRYPVIEISMALVVLVLLDAFFVGEVRGSTLWGSYGLTEHITHDWPILLAHIVLFACLLSMSAIDLEHYWVDIRFTNFATMFGFAMHALWTPHKPGGWYAPDDGTALMAMLMLGGLGLVWVLFICSPEVDPEDFGEREFLEDPPPSTTTTTPFARMDARTWFSPSRAIVWVTGLLLLALLVAMAVVESGNARVRFAPRALLPLLLFFGLILRESIVVRESDDQIAEAIESERHGARAMAVAEWWMLFPAICFGAIGAWLFVFRPDVADHVGSALRASIAIPSLPMMGDWSPLSGIARAATGYIIAGGIGWLIRIVFTLAFGKEALGTGDIHMMAAAGCVLGWPIVLLGFMLTCGLALTGWVCALPFKRSRAIPLGPWLSLSFLAVTVFYEEIISWPIVDNVILAVPLLISHISQGGGRGVMP